MFELNGPTLVLVLGALAFLALLLLLIAFTIAARRWARETAQAGWSTGFTGRPIAIEPIDIRLRIEGQPAISEQLAGIEISRDGVVTPLRRNGALGPAIGGIRMPKPAVR